MMKPASLRLGRSNLYFLDSGDGLILIDAGAPQHSDMGGWAILDYWLASLGYHPIEIRALLLTHAHPDHLALAQALQRWGAKVFVHQAEADALAGRIDQAATERLTRDLLLEHGVPDALAEQWAKFSSRRWSSPSVEPDGILSDGDEITWGNLRLQAIHCPGHSPGSTAYYHPETKSLFSGDHLLRRTLPHIGVYYGEEGRFRALPAYLRSLDKVATLEIDRVYPGHGPPFGEAGRAIAWLRRQHEGRLRQVIALLRQGPMTAFELMLQVFPRLRPAHWRLGLAQVIGCLDELEARGWVVVERRERERSFQATESSI